jgi:hypothetical protein
VERTIIYLNSTIDRGKWQGFFVNKQTTIIPAL